MTYYNPHAVNTHDLATYNSEVARGIVHTDEWKARMAEQQQAFIVGQLAEADSKGWTIANDPRTAT